MKRMKNITAMVVMLLCVAMSGCGANRTVETSTNEITEQVADEQEEVTVTEEIDNAQATVEEEIKEVEELTEETESSEESITVYNNGGHFVGYENKIYYISPDAEAMYATQLFAEYLDTYCGPGFLMAYNCESDSLEVLEDGNFYGKLWLSNDKLFVSLYDEESEAKNKIGIYDIIGDEVTEAKGQYLLGGDKKGEFVVTGEYTQNGYYLYVYKEGEQRLILEESGYSSFVGIEDGYLVYAYHDEDYNRGLKCVDINDACRTYDLGMVPERELEDYGSVPEFEQYVIQDGKLFLSVCWYEGTGHFLAEQTIVGAELTKENSIEKLILPEVEKEYEDETLAYAVRDGKAEYVDGIPMTAYITYSDGDYGYYDENGHKVACGDGFGVQYDEDDDISFMNECIEYVNGRICMVNNHLVRNPSEDIGWRYAYIRKYTSIFIEEAGVSDGCNVENICNQDYIDE